MMNILEKEYGREQEIKAAYEAAETAGSEEGMQAARDAYKAFLEGIDAKGEDFAKVYRLYSEAKERGNEYIDISDCYDYRDEAKLIATFREYGVGKFTFSSSWSSAAESAWKFLQSGCTLEGMVEINSRDRNFFKDGEYEKAHGYLFSIR